MYAVMLGSYELGALFLGSSSHVRDGICLACNTESAAGSSRTLVFVGPKTLSLGIRSV